MIDMKRYLMLAACIFFALLSGCTSVPTLKEIEETKPAPFRAQVEPIPKSCGTIPEPKVNLTIDQYQHHAGASYRGALGKNSIVDPKIFQEWREQKKPLDDWGAKVGKAAHAYAANGDVESGKCAVAFIDEWARGNALLGELKSKDLLGPGQQVEDRYAGMAYWQLMSTVPQAATLYFRVKDVATPEQDARIKWWLAQLNKRLKYFWTTYDGRNNHLAWTGVAVMQIGILTDSKEDIEYARKVFNEMLSSVKQDGISSIEIRRGHRSFFFHNFLVEAMTAMAQMSKLIGEDWWTNPKLQKMISTVAEAQVNPSAMAEFDKQSQSSKKQDIYTEWGWYGLLPDNDPRRIRFVQFMKSGPVVANPWLGDSSEKKIMLTKIPDCSQLGGNTEVFRDLIEKRKK
jgi:poly(beta-D-mannuronate) lyase